MEKSLAKVKKFNIRNSGSVKYKRAGANHNTVSYKTKRLRRLRKVGQLSNSDTRRLKRRAVARLLTASPFLK